MKIGIMGGTFNPVHNAHLMLAQFAKEEYSLDKILFMPCGNPPHKKNMHIADAEHRLEMVRIACSDNPDFEVSGYEVRRGGYSYTADTLEHLKITYPSDEFAFIIGSDSLLSMNRWYHPERILELCTILVFERSGYAVNDEMIERVNEKYGANVFLLHAPKFEISSSMMRKRIQNGQSIRYLIPDGVIEYINTHLLYESGDRYEGKA